MRDYPYLDEILYSYLKLCIEMGMILYLILLFMQEQRNLACLEYIKVEI